MENNPKAKYVIQATITTMTQYSVDLINAELYYIESGKREILALSETNTPRSKQKQRKYSSTGSLYFFYHRKLVDIYRIIF